MSFFTYNFNLYLRISRLHIIHRRIVHHQSATTMFFAIIHRLIRTVYKDIGIPTDRRLCRQANTYIDWNFLVIILHDCRLDLFMHFL